MRGRKPKPINQRIAEGDVRGRGVHKLDAIKDAQIAAVRGLPEAPAHLCEAARRQWNVWKEDLECMEQDFHADAAMLEGACVNYVRAVEADATLKGGCQLREPVLDKSTGLVIGHKLKNHPAVSVSRECWAQVRSFCSELGLSLVARQRLSIDVQDRSANELLDILTKPRPADEDDAALESIQ